MNQKKIHLRAATVCLSLACLLPALPHAQAAAVSAQPMDTVFTLVSPRFKYITRMSSSLSISSSGYANCTGSYTIYEEYSGSITMTLQRYEDGKWTDVKEWSEDYVDTGAQVLNKGYYVTSGYRYRMVTEVIITDADGSVIEDEFCDSPVSEY